MQTSHEPETQPLRNHVAQLQGVITAMESSKFWQIRNAWFRLKQNMGLGKDNFQEIRSLSAPDALTEELAKPSAPALINHPMLKVPGLIHQSLTALIHRSLTSLTRENIADLYLQGQGIEIGALHHPLVVPKDVKVLYVDRMSVADLRQQYPELNDLPLIEADILANGEDLATIADNTQDFVIANHFIEHCQDTIGTIQNMLRVLKPGGILYSAIPNKEATFDIDREVTSLEHMWQDHNESPARSKRDHFESWVRHVGHFQDEVEIANQVDRLIEMDYSIHYHVFTKESWLELFVSLQQKLAIRFEIELVFNNGSHEIILIARKLPSS